MKKYIIRLLILLNFCYCINADIKELLISHKWGPEIGALGYTLIFDKDNNFNTSINYEGSEIFKGTYNINNNKIILSIKQILTSVESYKQYINKEYTFEIKNSDKSIFFNQYISCLTNDCPFSNIFWNKDSIVPINSNRLFNEIEVVTVHKNSKIIADNVFLREKPDINSRKYKLSEFKLNGENKETYFLANGREIYVICRTKNKQKVNKWENYWYYIDTKISGYSYLKLENDKNIRNNSCVWIYGEFIKF